MANSTRTACISETVAPTGSWPVGLATNTLAVATQPADTGSNDLSGGAIAGIVIGVIAALLILAGLLLWLLRRRKRRREQDELTRPASVDLGEDDNGHDPYANPQAAPMIEPYRPVGSFVVPTHREDSPPGESRSSSYPPDSGTFVPALEAGRDSSYADEESGPGVAGPLPSKSTRPFPVQPLSHRVSGTETSRTSQSQRDSGKAPSNVHISTNTNTGSGAELGGVRSMRLANPDSPTASSLPSPRAQRRSMPTDSPSSPRGPTFRRHEDAGRVSYPDPSDDVVDLPPLYTEVPRDGPRPGEAREGV